MEPFALALALVIGLLAGLAAGAFGVGGGVLMVPALLALLPGELPAGRAFHTAKAASLLVMCAVTALGIAQHRRAQHVDLRWGLLLAAGGVAGSAAAVLAAEGLADRTLRVLFGLALVAVGARLWFGVRPRAGPTRRAGLPALPVGFAAGALAGLLGIGGGILMVPAMVFLGLPVHVAVGTSLVAVLANALAGTATHLQLGYGPAIVALGAPLALGAAVGIVAGARLATRTAAPRLRRAFGVFLALVGAAMAIASA